MSLQIAMMASPRARPYVVESLESLFARDTIDVPVRVVACTSDPAFTGKWVDDARVEVELLDDGVFRKAYPGFTIYRKISETFLRCIVPAAEAGDDLVLLQDDVRFAWRWLSITRAISTEANERLHLRYHHDKSQLVLALFSPGRYYATDTPLAPYKASGFYANIGLWFSANTLPGLVTLTRQRLGEMDDMIVKEHIMRNGAQLYAVNPNVVQHTGDASTHGGTFVRSPTFSEEWPPLRTKWLTKPGPAQLYR